jgi:hypothetical protein
MYSHARLGTTREAPCPALVWGQQLAKPTWSRGCAGLYYKLHMLICNTASIKKWVRCLWVRVRVGKSQPVPDPCSTLGATEDTLCVYQVLSKHDLQVDTSVQDPRMRNLHRSRLSWIWHVNAQEDMSSINWMSECKLYS